MKKIKSTDIITPELEAGAIYNDEFEGFHQDYLVLHCLLRKHEPKSIFEIGTNMGTGTNIICNAAPLAKVFSLDLPTELCHQSLQHPISEGKGDNVGSNCKRVFTQLRGDSMNFDYSQYPCEAYYVDGEHDEQHVAHEAREIIKQKPKLIVFHDSDIPGVRRGIIAAFWGHNDYEVFRVEDTRIAYALLK